VGFCLCRNKRVVEKVEECVGEYTVACSFRNVEDQFTWAFTGVYGPNYDCDRRFLWMNWLGCSVGGTCHGALGEISTSLVFLAKIG
jgi:hypothetical protein